MADVEELLSRRLGPAFDAVAGESVSPAVRRSQHADFQADGALAVGRKLGISPREAAERVLRQADLSDLCSRVEITGPGSSA
jgi:arginyl-tRNA synthetase